MLTQLLKMFRALNSETGPWQIAFAGGFALIIGLTPLWSVHNVLVLLLVFVLRVHLASFFVLWAVFTGFAFLLDPWFDHLGYQWLTSDAWEGLWTRLYQSDWWQVTRFNHTITLASLAASLLLFLPTVLSLRVAVVRYRDRVMPILSRMKIVQAAKASRLYELYQKLN